MTKELTHTYRGIPASTSESSFSQYTSPYKKTAYRLELENFAIQSNYPSPFNQSLQEFVKPRST